MMKKKILIFYISKYSGHYHAAMAIEEALLARWPDDAEVEKINALDYTNPILGRIINRIYLRIIKKRPEIWGNMYDNPEVLKKTRRAREALHKFNMSKIKRLVKRKKPDIILCTQAFPCGMVADFKKVTGSKLKLIGVLTDHAPHSYWLFDEVDFYVTPDEKTAAALYEKGISRDRIKAYGIPVGLKYRKRRDRRKIIKELDISDKKPTLLVMGGSQGLGAIEQAVKSLSRDKDHDYQLLVVAGKNRKLLSRLSRSKVVRSNPGIKLFSFVENIEELMEVSDVIITKAGGMTTAEALAKGLPMIIVDPIPGHERLNADYLVGEGAAVEIKDYDEMHRIINRLFDSRETIAKMRSRAESIAKPDSALDIARLAILGK
jgi:processive 1,2-diacylglycerol beta-glucosyltransferase